MDKNGWEIKPEGWENFEKEYLNYSKLGTTVSININNKNNEPDCIFILAGGLDINGNIHEWVKRRLNLAITIFNHLIYKVPLICLGGGTYHKSPILNCDGFVIHESTACAKYLTDCGIPSKYVMKEWASFDTVANAYFSLVNFCIPRKWTNIKVITSEFHLPRTTFLFKWIYNLYFEDEQEYNITIDNVYDDGIDKTIIESRKEREKHSLESIINVSKQIKNMEEFHNWFFLEHKAYNCEPNVNKVETLEEDVNKSY